MRLQALFREVSAHKPSKQTLIMEDIQEKYNHLLQQNEALRQENEELKLLLHAHGIEYKPKVLTILALTPFSLLCPFHGKVLSPNMLADCTAKTKERKMCASMITLTFMNLSATICTGND